MNRGQHATQCGHSGNRMAAVSKIENEPVTVALGTKRRPGIRPNQRRLFNAESRKPVKQRGVAPKHKGRRIVNR